MNTDESRLTLHETSFGRFWRFWNERAINCRLATFDESERNHMVIQMLAKIEAILLDEKTKDILSRSLICSKTSSNLENPVEVLRRKYGSQMEEWLVQGPYSAGSNPSNYSIRTLKKILEPLIMNNPDETFLHLKTIDPLTNWFRQPKDISGRMMARIQNLAESISKRVGWSFLIDPGRLRTDLSAFISEFDTLEGFFDKAELSMDETSQKAFEPNHNHKVRNRKLVCVDWSRVKLNKQFGPRANAASSELVSSVREREQSIDFLIDCDYPRISLRTENHDDFINASYVVGGPLLNTFILTQAPLTSTISDFWQMVLQEKCEYIFMLCDAVDPESVALFNSSAQNHCPYYWPRKEGELCQYGLISVSNVKLDFVTDPLFNITNLEIWLTDSPEQKYRVQHWHWDWRNYDDFLWPLRLLMRSRHSTRPTIVQCLDGCGRSGTLVLIEILLMQLLRGAVSYENPMLTSAVFLRLQRRYAVANHKQYLYVYRTILNWIQPFVISRFNRFVLDFI